MRNEKHIGAANGFSRTKTCCERFDVSPATWWRFHKEGRIPPAIKLATRTTVWANEQLDELAALFRGGKDWRDHHTSEQTEV